MKSIGWLAAALMMVSSAPVAIGQAGVAAPVVDRYEPRRTDIRSATRLRHTELWFAGESKNWDLAAYELRQLKAGLTEAALMYPGVPVSGITTMSAPIQDIAHSIAEKNVGKFKSSFANLTSGCTACHQSVGLGFIAMRVPTTSPFSNQVVSPQRQP